MVHTEADRLHAGLISTFVDVLPRIAGARHEQRHGFRLTVCPRIPLPGFNGVWVDGPDSRDALDELRDGVREVEEAGVPCWVQVRAGATPRFEDAARRLGFHLDETTPGMVVAREELIQGSPATVTRVRDSAGLLEASTIAAAGFDVPADMFMPVYTTEVADAPGVAVYVARSGAEGVSTATAWTGEGGVGIFNVATLPMHRGRGYGRATTERAIRDGFAAGADLAWLQASALGEPLYRAMGFRQVATYLLYGRGTYSERSD